MLLVLAFSSCHDPSKKYQSPLPGDVSDEEYTSIRKYCADTHGHLAPRGNDCIRELMSAKIISK